MRGFTLSTARNQRSGNFGGATNVFSLDCVGNPVVANDGAVRRAHRFMVTLRNSVRSAVALP